jgi:hypothetical protein
MDWVVDTLNWISICPNKDLNLTEAWNINPAWPLVTMLKSWEVASISKQGSCTATRWIIKNSIGTIVATATFSWNTATFSTPYAVTAWQQYYFQADSDWASYTRAYTSTSWTLSAPCFVYPYSNNANISSVSILVDSPSATTYVKTDWWFTFSIYKKDYTTMAISWNSHYVDYAPPFPDDTNFFSLSTTVYNPAVSVNNNSLVSFPSLNTWLWIEWTDLYDMTVSWLWILLVSKFKWLQPIFIELDWTPHTIPASTVWNPTIWTIYKWKIILWW